MSKTWILIGTNALGFGVNETREEKLRREKKFSTAIHNTPKLSLAKLVAKADKDNDIKVAETAQLLQAYNDKKLKSKTLIKQAKTLKSNKKKTAATEVATA
jgi:hypothetical protein